MNGFSKHELDEDAFGEKKDVGAGLKTFDAFRAFPLSFLSVIAPKTTKSIEAN
jgi:hypothetical protein